MTKNRIVALLLAGLMTTAAMTSCRVQNNHTNPGGTEPENPTTNQTTPNDPGTIINPPTVTWQDVDKSVYTFGEVKLREEALNTGKALATIPKETELHCTKQNTSWYYVEYEKDGETLQGYVSKPSVTEIDILGTDFVDYEGGAKTMYVKTETLNVRLYPSDQEFSSKVGTYNLNDEVTALATNGTWVRVQYSEDKIYYVSKSYLADAPVEDPNDLSKYEGLFTDVEGKPVMYVDYVSQVKFRKAPNTSSDELLALSKGDAVTVLKTGVVDGKNWTYAVVELAPQKPGDGTTYKYGYISSDCLSYNNGEMTLPQLLKRYPMFQEGEATTMYVLLDATITIRSTPEFPEKLGEDNSLSHPQSVEGAIKAVTILATGEIDGTRWYIVNYTKMEGTTEKTLIGFIANGAMEYLTSDPNGKETVTLEDLMLKYPGQFEELETPIAMTTKSVANCYGTPATTNEPLKQLAEGTAVTLVAKEKGDFVTWAVIQDAEGAYYFVNFSLLNQAR